MARLHLVRSSTTDLYDQPIVIFPVYDGTISVGGRYYHLPRRRRSRAALDQADAAMIAIGSWCTLILSYSSILMIGSHFFASPLPIGTIASSQDKNNQAGNKEWSHFTMLTKVPTTATGKQKIDGDDWQGVGSGYSPAVDCRRQLSASIPVI